MLIIGVAAAYLTRDVWARHWTTSGAGDWAPLTPHGAAVMQHAIVSIALPGGPAYVQVTGADFASYALKGTVPKGAQAAVIDDKLHVRSRVDLKNFADVPKIVGDTQVVELAGTIDVPRPGVAKFRATEIKVGDVPLPPVLISRIFHGADSATVGLPTAIGDIRVSRGHITLYKKIP